MRRALADSSLGIGIIDVRESSEFHLSHVKGVNWIPMSDLPQRFPELDPERTYYFFCRTGARSLRAVKLLKERGLAKVKSVRGGLLAWAERIDAAIVKY
jgi:adenylyltransferase/sulfurtransferase